MPDDTDAKSVTAFPDHRCKKRFLRFYSCHVLNVFNVFFILSTFYIFKKRSLKIP